MTAIDVSDNSSEDRQQKPRQLALFFEKKFHFIPSRFADTLRQTKSMTFTIVYEYVCVYRRDEVERSARKKPHT
jgi:hypothetical protein